MLNSSVNAPLNTTVHTVFTLSWMNEEPIDVLLAWAKEKNWSHSQLARELGESPQTIYNWRQRGLPADKYSSVAKRFGRSVSELLGDVPPRATGVVVSDAGEGADAVTVYSYPSQHKPGSPIALDSNDEYPAIRRVRFKLSAGATGFAIDFLDDDDAPIVFRAEWYRGRGLNPEKLFAVRVANGSMQPGLWADDTVVVNTADTTPRDGEVFAVNFEGELVIKRLVRDEGRWWLKSDNPDQTRYPRKALGEGVFIIGRVVHKQSEHI